VRRGSFLARWSACAAVTVAACFAASCATYQAYEGPTKPASQVATIEGTAKLRTTLPLALVIRSVDGREVGLQYASVAVEPGKHRLLIDCQVSGPPASTSRHELEVDLAPGVRYRLSARMDAGNRSCADVALESI
jgi:hypothetical protein